MNPLYFTGSSTTEDLENFTKELKKVFGVMHVAETKRVQLAAYQLKDTARTWSDQCKEGRDEGAPPASLAYFEEAFLRRFFPRQLTKSKVRELLTLKSDYLSVHDYGLKFTQLSRYVPEMVKHMMSRLSLFVDGLGLSSSKQHYLLRTWTFQG